MFPISEKDHQKLPSIWNQFSHKVTVFTLKNTGNIHHVYKKQEIQIFYLSSFRSSKKSVKISRYYQN